MSHHDWVFNFFLRIQFWNLGRKFFRHQLMSTTSTAGFKSLGSTNPALALTGGFDFPHLAVVASHPSSNFTLGCRDVGSFATRLSLSLWLGLGFSRRLLRLYWCGFLSRRLGRCLFWLGRRLGLNSFESRYQGFDLFFEAGWIVPVFVKIWIFNDT